VSGPADRVAGPDHLRARVRRGTERVTVVLTGDLDRLTGPLLVDLVAGLGEHPADCIDIDLAEVGFLDLGGVRALLRVHRDCALEGVAVLVLNPRYYVRWLLEVTGVAELVLADHHDRVAQADPTPARIRRRVEPGPDPTAGERQLRERAVQADDRDRLADERENLLDERQRRLTAHQQWEDIREELADQRERDLERRERDD
jgi:anti-anti-sigma factor